MNKGYDGPTLHVCVTRVEESASASKYRWQVTMRAADATGGRKLGYRGAGNLDDRGKIKFESGPEVHDENRPVWTTMNATDRSDIRRKMESLVLFAIEKINVSKQSKFEHLVK
ncbi:hypothetical protein ABIA00_004366 [Bradyrhizobium ottawaense]|uniref:hypothetical protein n=1 Tax=Bradyrhizobium ottawaense TaxID=931866 RepID=UPI0038372BF3